MVCIFANIVIFRPKSIRYSRFLLWSCDAALLYKNRTCNTILRWLTWSFNCLYHGRHPTARPGNRPLTQAEQALAGTWLTRQKYQFQVCELRGDWEWHKTIWQFKCSWKGGVRVGICYRCPAMVKSNDPGLLYWNMDDEDSTWARGEFGTAEYISQRVPPVNVWISCHYSAIVLEIAPFCLIALQCITCLFIEIPSTSPQWLFLVWSWCCIDRSTRSNYWNHPQQNLPRSFTTSGRIPCGVHQMVHDALHQPWAIDGSQRWWAEPWPNHVSPEICWGIGSFAQSTTSVSCILLGTGMHKFGDVAECFNHGLVQIISVSNCPKNHDRTHPKKGIIFAWPVTAQPKKQHLLDSMGIWGYCLNQGKIW